MGVEERGPQWKEKDTRQANPTGIHPPECVKCAFKKVKRDLLSLGPQQIIIESLPPETLQGSIG